MRNFIFSLKVLKAKKEADLNLIYYVSQEIWLGNSKKLVCKDQSRFKFPHSPDNSETFYITSKYFSFFSNEPPAI